MSDNKMKFVIELENGQYRIASQKVIKDTEKIEKSARKSYKGMDDAGKEFNQKMRRYLSFGALFGTLFAVGYGAFSKLFSAIEGGVKRAIENNAELNRKLLDMKYAFEDLFNSVGVFLTPIIDQIATATDKALEFVTKTNKTQRTEKTQDLTKTNNDLKERLKFVNEEIKKGGVFKGLYENEAKNLKFRIKTNQDIIDGINKQIDGENKLNSITKEQRGEEKKITEEKRKQEAIKDVVASQEESVNQAKLLNAEQEKYQSGIEGITSEMGQLVTSGSEAGQQFVKISSQAKGIFENIQKAVEAQQALNMAESSGKMISGDYLAIIIAILAAFVSLMDRLNTNNDIINDQIDYEEEINRQLELQKIKLESISLEMQKQENIINTSSDKQNKTIEDYQELIQEHQDLIDLKEEQIKLDEETIAVGGDTTRLETLTKEVNSITDQLDTLKKLRDNSKGIFGEDTQATKIYKGLIDSLESMKSDYLGQIALINASISAESDRLTLLSEIEDEMQTIYELQKEMYQAQVDTDELEIKLLETKMKSTTNTDDVELQAEIIDLIVEQIDYLNQELAVTTDTNEQLELMTTIQEKSNALEEIKTEELEKQLDLMKDYVDLGVDLENIRVVKQLTANFAAQGYTGSALGAQLQDLGVSNKAISGRSLNIYGDINNTLNQATVNQSITSLNNIINSIGGV